MSKKKHPWSKTRKKERKGEGKITDKKERKKLKRKGNKDDD